MVQLYICRTTCDFNKLNGRHLRSSTCCDDASFRQCQMGISLENCPKKSRWKEVVVSAIPNIHSTPGRPIVTPTKVLIALLSNWVIALEFLPQIHTSFYLLPAYVASVLSRVLPRLLIRTTCAINEVIHTRPDSVDSSDSPLRRFALSAASYYFNLVCQKVNIDSTIDLGPRPDLQVHFAILEWLAKKRRKREREEIKIFSGFGFVFLFEKHFSEQV